MVVYHLDTGDTCPETHAVVDEVRHWVPNFVTVQSDVKTWRANYGIPSDLAPARNHTLGVIYGMSDVKIANSMDCCWFNSMKPLHDRMVADGVEVVIRGTKASDTGKVNEGDTGYYEVVLPIRDWSDADVFAYLSSVGAPKNALYDFHTSFSAPECLGCTAWWDDRRSAYLKERHPAQYEQYKADLQKIARAVQGHLDDLNLELGACHGA